MVDSDKLDEMVNSIHRIETSLKVLETRMDSVDKTLASRAEALANIYTFMQKTSARLIKIETNKEDEAIVRSWFAPYVIAVFSSVVSYLVLHFWGK
jgi:hypothetical protein